jgi:hypothetical protein
VNHLFLPAVTGTATAVDNCTPQASLVINYIDDFSACLDAIIPEFLNAHGPPLTFVVIHLPAFNKSGSSTTPFRISLVRPNVEISCSDSSSPDTTGWATGTIIAVCMLISLILMLCQLTSCNHTGLILRNWAAHDECGNVRTCVQLITVVDHTAPVLTCPHDTILDCGFYINPDVSAIPSELTNCTPSDELALDYHDDLSGLTGCTNTGVILRTWYMTDLCGNTGSCIQRITIADTTKPMINCPPNKVINCTDSTAPILMEKQRLPIIVQPACSSKLLIPMISARPVSAMAQVGYTEHGEQKISVVIFPPVCSPFKS